MNYPILPFILECWGDFFMSEGHQSANEM